PQVETLERRITPTTFKWTNLGGDGIWENAPNWSGGGAGAYPGYNGTAATTNDIAQFAPGANADALMQSAHELAQVRLVHPDMGNVVLRGQLTLNNGGFMAGGTIIQRTVAGNGPIVISGGTFTWTGGNINYSLSVTTTASTFTVQNGAI